MLTQKAPTSSCWHIWNTTQTKNGLKYFGASRWRKRLQTDINRPTWSSWTGLDARDRAHHHRVSEAWAEEDWWRWHWGGEEKKKRQRRWRWLRETSVRIHTNKAVLSHMTNSQQLYDLQINLNSTNSSSTGLINSPDLLHPANRRAALASQHRHPPPSDSCCQILMFQLDVRQSVSILWPGSETQQSTIFLQNH